METPLRPLIRLATVQDLEQVQNCARLAYAKYRKRMDREPAPMNADFASQIAQGCVRVAMVAGEVAGYVVFYPKGGNLHLENVAVHPAHAGKGVGKSLILYVEQRARENGFAAVDLYTNEAMTENLGMYGYLGYVELERRLDGGFRRVFFQKAL